MTTTANTNPHIIRLLRHFILRANIGEYETEHYVKHDGVLYTVDIERIRVNHIRAVVRHSLDHRCVSTVALNTTSGQLSWNVSRKNLNIPVAKILQALQSDVEYRRLNWYQRIGYRCKSALTYLVYKIWG